MMVCAVFDLDGTLADTSADLLNAANACFVALGYSAPLSMEQRQIALLGGRPMLRFGARQLGLRDENEFADLQYDHFLDHYRNNLAVETALYPYADDVLREMRADGWQTAICTNKPVDLAEKLLVEIQAFDDFDALVGVGSLPERKPDPKPLLHTLKLVDCPPEHAIFIGDSHVDYETAQAAGVDLILVDFDNTNIREQYEQVDVVYDFLELAVRLREWKARKLSE